MTHRLVKAARGKHIGKRVDKPDEDEHFMPCPNCGAPIDMRDLGQVLERRSVAIALAAGELEREAPEPRLEAVATAKSSPVRLPTAR